MLQANVSRETCTERQEDKTLLYGDVLMMKMRRKDREITDSEEIKSIIEKCRVINLGLNAGEYPYVVAVNYAHEVEKGKHCFYFHSAKEGKKLDLIAADNKCSFLLYNDMHVETRGFEHCTNYYESVMGTGIITEITVAEDKIKAAKMLLRKHQRENVVKFEKELLDRTYFGKITVETISAKAQRRKQND